jgi:hypothetical protein
MESAVLSALSRTTCEARSAPLLPCSLPALCSLLPHSPARLCFPTRHSSVARLQVVNRQVLTPHSSLLTPHFRLSQSPAPPLRSLAILSPQVSSLFPRGPLAQLVEQLTLNQRVEGSSPSRSTKVLQLKVPTPGGCFAVTGPRSPTHTPTEAESARIRLRSPSRAPFRHDSSCPPSPSRLPFPLRMVGTAKTSSPKPPSCLVKSVFPIG